SLHHRESTRGQTVAEPAGYRTDNCRAPVPAGLTCARTANLAGLPALLAKGEVPLADVIPAQPKPSARPANATRDEPASDTIKGAVWLANMGYGRLTESEEKAFKEELLRRAGSLDRPIVMFCEPDCWMSWNAAKRALSYGFRNIIWFPGGVTAWREAGLEAQ